MFIVVISKLGVESSSFVAILGAAGLAVGLSLWFIIKFCWRNVNYFIQTIQTW